MGRHRQRIEQATNSTAFDVTVLVLIIAGFLALAGLGWWALGYFIGGAS